MPQARWILAGLLLLGALAPGARPAFGGDGEDAGTCSLSGTVTRDGRPAPARIEGLRLGGPERAGPFGTQPPGGVAGPAAGESPEEVAARAQAGEDGAFCLEGLRAGVYAVRATAPQERVAVAIVLVPAPGAKKEVTLALAAARTLRGRLVWTDGRPVEGRIVLTARRRGQGRTSSGPYEPWNDAEPHLPDGPTWSAVLGPDGTFAIGGLTPSPHAIRVLTSGQGTLYGYEAWRPTGEPLDWTVAVARQERSGRVLDAESGEPIDQAHIAARFRPSGGPIRTVRARSDADGGFSLRTTADAVTLTVEADGYARQVVGAEADGETEVRLARLRRVTGRTLRADGEPAAGAVVVVASANRQPPWTRRATSDGEGRFTVEGVPAGQAVAFVRGGGWASVDLDQVDRFGPNPFLVPVPDRVAKPLTLAVEPAGRLGGRVLDEAGQPVAGATVRVLGMPRARSRMGFANPAARVAHLGLVAAATDGSGAFAVEDLVPGLVYELEVSAPGRPTLRRGPYPGDAEPAKPMEIRFPRSRWVDVRVLLEGTSSPVPDARVGLVVDRGAHDWRRSGDDVLTDAEGRARLGPVGDGPLAVRASAPGTLWRAEPWPIEGSAHGDGPFSLSVRLAPGLRIAGRVLDAAGGGQAGAVVRARRQGEGSARAAAEAEPDGTFVLKGLLPGTYALRVRVPDVGVATLGARTEVAAGAEGVILRLTAAKAPPVHPLRVRVVDAAGEAVPRADVTLVGRRRTMGTSARKGVADFTLDASGQDAVIRELARGALFVLVEHPKDAAGSSLPLGAAVAGPIGPEQHELTVRLPAEQVIEGRVLGPQGQALVGVAVEAEGPLAGPEDGRHARTRERALTDGEGRFRLRQLALAEYTLAVRAGERFQVAAPVRVRAGARDVEIRLEAGLTIAVRVLDDQGEPLAGVRMRLGVARARGRRGARPGRRTSGDWRAVTAEDGSARITRLDPEETYDVEIWPPGGREDLREVRIDSWTPEPLEVRLPRGVTVSGSVRDAQGRLLSGAEVRIETKHSVRHLRASDGTFRVIRLVPGRIVVRARLPGPGAREWENREVPEIVLHGGGDVVLVLREP